MPKTANLHISPHENYLFLGSLFLSLENEEQKGREGRGEPRKVKE